MTDEQEKLLAALVDAGHKLPGGYQVAMGMRLERAVANLERLFDEHDLPLRPQLLAELTLWREHARQGVELMERGYGLLDQIIQAASQ